MELPTFSIRLWGDGVGRVGHPDLGSSAQPAQSTQSEQPAQSAGTEQLGLEEIIVTAEKRAENVQRVPLSIVAISGEALENAGVKGPLDLPKLVPALQISTTAYGGDLDVRIRGFGSPTGGNAAIPMWLPISMGLSSRDRARS